MTFWRPNDNNMDELTAYNKERWEELAQAGVLYACPLLKLDEEAARAWLEVEGLPPGGLTDLGFALLRLWKLPRHGDPNAAPGTCEHYIAICPPWLGYWLANVFPPLHGA
jgi:hypothetical protein